MRLVRVLAATAVVTAALVGCSGREQANETLPSASSSAAQTTEALPPLGPPDLPMPDEARVETPEGASAFVAYYFSLMNRAQTQLSSTGLRELSSDCNTCTVFADGIDEYTERGYRLNGGGIRFDGASAPVLEDGKAQFSVALTQLRLEVVGADGSRVTDQSSEETSYPASGAAAIWNSQQSSWLMADLTIQ